MDYHSLKRRELQALCKEHNIPANSANSVLADKLSALLNEKQKPITRKRTCIKSSVETTDEGEPAASKRQAKKVRFSPSNDLVEYELHSGEQKRDMVTQIKSRRKSVAKNVDKPLVDNSTTVELVDDSTQIPVKLTRSRVQLSGKDVVIQNNEKKQNRREAKDVEKGTVVDKETVGNVGKVMRSKAHTLDIVGGVQREESRQSKRLNKDVENASESVKETVVSRARVTRSKVQISMEGGTGPDVNPHIKKNSGKQVETEAQDVKPFEEIMDIPVRATRSRRLNKDVEKASESVKETVVSRARVTRCKEQTSMEGGTGSDVNPHIKKKSGKQVETEAHDVKPFEEIMDIPVRATRSRRPTVKEDVYTDTNPQADKKRTRREMKATDLSNNLSHVAPVDKKELPKRKSLRTRGVEIVDKDEDDKVEVVNNGRVTRSKAPLEIDASGSNSKNKANKVEIQQPEEPSKNACKKDVNRRKSVLHPVKTEVVLHLEVPLNRPARKNTGRTSVIQKTTITVESPTVGKKQSTGQSGSLSMIVEGLEDVKNVIRSGKDASENEFKEVTLGSPKSRKQRGTSIIENQIIETEHGSFVDKSPKSSSHSVSRSEGKSVVKKQVDSSLKKPVSRMNNQSSVEHGSKGKSWAVRSGAMVRDSSSKKRAKLSGMKQSDSANHDVNSSKEGTPVAKMGNFKPDEKVTEPEVTSAIDKSDRRFTRSVVRSERKEPSRSAIKELRFTRSTIRSKRKEPSQSAFKQPPIPEAQLSSPAAKFQHDPAVNTAPGRITRRRIKHGVNAAGSFSEKVSKKKQTSQSAQKKQPLDDAQMASTDVEEVGPNPDADTIGVQSEIKQSLDEHMSSPEVAEVGPNTVIDIIGVRSEIKEPYDDAQMCSPEAAEVWLDPDSDAIEVGSEISKEVTGEVFGELLASESVWLPSKVMEENKVPTSGTSIDMESVSLVSVEKASGEVMKDAGACIEKLTHEASSTPCLTESLLAGKQQNPMELQSFDDETPLGKNLFHIKMTSVSISDGFHVQNQNEEAYVESGIFSETVNLETSVLKSERPDAKEKEIELIGSGSASKGLQADVMIEEPFVSVGKVVVVEGVDISSLGVATKGNNGDSDSNCDPISYDIGSSTINGSKELEAGSELSNANKTIVVPISGNGVDIECVLEDNSDVQDGESERDQLKSNDIHATDEEDIEGYDLEPAQNECMPVVAEVLVRSCDHEPEQILNVSVDDVLCDTVGQSDLVASKDSPNTLAASGIDDIAVRVDALEESVLNINKDVVSSILGDIYDMDAEDDHANEPKESGGISPDMSNGQTKEEAGMDGGNDHIIDDQEQAVATDKLDSDSVNFMVDGSHIGVNEVDSELVGNLKAPEDPTREEALPNLYVKGESTVDIIDSSPLMGDIDAHESLITKESLSITYRNEEYLPTIKEDVRNDSEPAQNECIPVVAEVLVRSCDHEPAQILNVSFDDVPCYTVGQSDSVVSKDSPKTRASSGIDDIAVRDDALEESVLDINKDVVSSILGDIYDMDAEDDYANEQKSTEGYGGFQPKESGGIFPDMSNLQTKEEAGTGVGNDHIIDYQEQAVAIYEHDSDSVNFMVDGSHIGVNEVDSELVGNLKASEDPTREEASPNLYAKGESTVDGIDSSPLMGDICAHESLITKESLLITYRKEESPVDDIDSELPTIKEDGRNTQGTSVDWGDYDLGMDEFENSVSANRSAKVVGEGEKDDEDSDLQTSAGPSLSIEGSSGLAAGLAGVVKNLEKDSRNAADGKSKQDVDMLKDSENAANMTQGVFNWSDSSLKRLFTTPATTQTSHVKDLSLKSLFKTPATSRTSHAYDSKADAVNSVSFTFPYGRCNEDMGTSGTAARDFNHQWGNDQSKAFDSETQGNTVHSPENEIYGVPSFEDYPIKLFGEEVGGSYDGSRVNTHFEFKGDHVDQIRQFEFVSEAAGTSNLDPFGLKDELIHSHESEKKEETDDDLAFKTGHV